MVKYLLQRIGAENKEIVTIGQTAGSKAFGAHLELMGTFLTADVKHLLVCQVEHGLQRKCGLTDARLTTQQHDAARDEATTQHAVELGILHVDTRIIVRRDILQSQHLGSIAAFIRYATTSIPVPHPFGRTGSGRHLDLLERVPLTAGRTFANPFGRLLPAVLADIHHFILRHRTLYNKQ